MANPTPIRSGRQSEIPDKLYFRIGEVAKLCEVLPYVLRFWESEFPQLKPNKGGTGQRLYRKKDVEMALRIKRLLYDEGYTIPGARQVFKSEARQKEPATLFRIDPEIPAASEHLRRMRIELQSIADLLGRPSPGTVPSAAKTGRPQRKTRLETVSAKEVAPAGDDTGPGRPPRGPALFS